ncbi:MAG: DUF86 domain-containing protein [Ignavibacteriae bacterium]|nr:DUF86 domain-containing protein [Ignavibacteriota bacterium]
MSAAKSDLIRIRHISDAARKAVHFFKGKSIADLTADEKLALALARLVEIMGEAASKVTDETQSRFPAIPWRAIVETRNRLIHGYDEVQLEILWKIIVDDLPPLIADLQKIIDEAEKQQRLF